MACSSHVGASYPVFVHRLALLLRASFGPSVAGTPLRFANPSPASGWVEDFHFQAAGHAQHTILRADCIGALWTRCSVARGRLKIGRRMQSCPTCGTKAGMVIS